MNHRVPCNTGHGVFSEETGMLEEQKQSTISLSNTILARDFGYGLMLEYKKRLYLTFLTNVLLILAFAAAASGFIQIYLPEDLSDVLVFLPAVVGLMYLYHTAVTCLSTATLMVTKERITVKRGPIPSFKDVSIDTKHIAKVFQQRRVVAWKVRWGRKWFGFRFEGSYESDDVYVRYVVGVITVDGRRIVLVREIPAAVDAKTLRENIQQRLGIPESSTEDELYSLFAASGFWNRITHSSSAGTFNGSPLSFLIFGAMFVMWATMELAAGEVRKGRWSNTMISSSTDPTYFTVSVLLTFAIACYFFYRGWRRFMSPSDRVGF